MEGPGHEIIGIGLAIVLGATFASLDAALVALGDPLAKAAREAGGPNGRAAARLLDAGPRIFARLLAGRVLFVSVAAVLATHLAAPFRSVALDFALPAAVAFAYGAVAEVLISWVRPRAHRVALPMLRLFRPLEIAMVPFAVPLFWVATLADRLFPVKAEDTNARPLELEVGQLIEQGEERGTITEVHADLLRGVLEFKDTLAREVMVPRTRTMAIDVEMPIPDVLRRIVADGHSRYPVYRGSLDQIEGVLVAKDLFRAIQERGIDDVKLGQIVRRPVFFAAETQKIGALLEEMQRKRAHLAIVVDEFGGTSGIVTLEDILEEIVGDIRDEHDTEEPVVMEVAPDRFVTDAGVSVSDVELAIGADLPNEDGDYESIGGMIVAVAGRVPTAGEAVSIGDFDMIVREADPRRISRVEIVRKRKVAEPEAEAAS